MDTKLKNRHKLAVILILFIIMIPAIVIVEQYGNVYYDMSQNGERRKKIEQSSGDFMGNFVDICYILYNTETDGGRDGHVAEFTAYIGEGYDDTFMSLLDYRVLDGSGNVIAKTMASSDSSYPSEENMNDYAIGMVITFDVAGRPSAVIQEGDRKSVV